MSQLSHVSKPCNPEFTLSPADNGDWIPMGWNRGDKITLSYGIARQVISAMVLIAEEPTYLIGDYKKTFYLVDLVGNQFIELDSSDHCPACDKIVCEHQTLQSILAAAGARETQTQNQPMATKPVPFADLEDAKHDESIACIEGKVLNVYDVKSGSGKSGRAYWFQNLVVKDAAGTEHRVCLADKKFKLETSNQGTTYRWTAKAGKDGTTGIKFNISGDEGQYRQIQITGTATMEVVSGAKPSEARSNSGTSSSGGSSKGRVDDNALELNAAYPAPFRIGQYFDILQLVQAENESRGTKLELEHQKDVATTIFLSFKGAYATYAPCVMEAGKAPPPASGALNSWKEYVYPSRDKKLGDMDKNELIPLIAWAYCTSPKGDDAKKTVANLIMAAADPSIALTPAGTIIAWFEREEGVGLNGGFLVEHLEKAVAAKFPDFDGISIAELNDDQAKKVLPSKVLTELFESATKIASDEAGSGADDDMPA